MRLVGWLVSLAPALACGSSTGTGAAPPACVDFTIERGDTSCATDADCAWVGALHVCPGDPSCGPENPVNVAAANRYEHAIAGVPLTPVSCGAPAPVKCVANVCKEP
jgi:hypothetical protein